MNDHIWSFIVTYVFPTLGIVGMETKGTNKPKIHEFFKHHEDWTKVRSRKDNIFNRKFLSEKYASGPYLERTLHFILCTQTSWVTLLTYFDYFVHQVFEN